MKESAMSSHYYDDHNNGSFRPIEILILLIITFSVIICLDVIFYSSTLEDAYITFRYSKHFAEGHGLGAWNIQGERVEGYTSFLWMFLISAAHTVGIEVRTAAKIIGILMHLILCSTLIAFPLLRRSVQKSNNDIFDNTNETVLAGVFLSLYLPISWYATSGMETVFFTTLTGLAFASIFLRQSGFLVPLLSVLLVLTRPEGIVVAGAVILLYAIVSHREGHSLRGAYFATTVAVIALGFLIVHRLILFGDIVPNTYWAKVGGTSFRHVTYGLQYVLDWATYHGVVVFLCAISVLSIYFSLVRARFRNLPWGFVVVLCLLFAFVAYIIMVGGDNYSAFPYWRHFIHLSAPITFLLCYVLARIRPQSRYFQLLVLLGIVFLTNLFILNAHSSMMSQSIRTSLALYPNLNHSGHNEYFIKLKRISKRNTTIASALGGELPYVVDAIHIDVLGLNTRHIAKYGSFDPAGPQDSKTDMKWVLEQHPDIIEGYIPGTMVQNGNANKIKHYLENNWRSMMLKEMVSSPIFQREYLFVCNWPYHSMDRALFIRESYLIDNQLQDELDCIAVANTLLSINEEKLHNN